MQDHFDRLASREPVFQAVLEKYGYPKIQVRSAGFAALCYIILEQQVSIASAKAAYVKLIDHIKEVTPGNILNTPDEAMRGCGISRQKTLYIKDLASRVASGKIDLENLGAQPEGVIRESLLAVKGIGNWTVEVYLMFCLQSPDIIPLGDIAIRSAIKELYGIREPAEMETHAARWQPYRTAASYILWQHYLGVRNRLS